MGRLTIPTCSSHPFLSFPGRATLRSGAIRSIRHIRLIRIAAPTNSDGSGPVLRRGRRPERSSPSMISNPNRGPSMGKPIGTSLRPGRRRLRHREEPLLHRLDRISRQVVCDREPLGLTETPALPPENSRVSGPSGWRVASVTSHPVIRYPSPAPAIRPRPLVRSGGILERNARLAEAARWFAPARALWRDADPELRRQALALLTRVACRPDPPSGSAPPASAPQAA